MDDGGLIRRPRGRRRDEAAFERVRVLWNQGLSVENIAKLEGLSESSIKRRLRLIRKAERERG